MRISLVSKGDAGNTCPYCRDSISVGEGRRCNNCKTTLHRECAEELHKCPTPGCGRSLSKRYRSGRVPSGGGLQRRFEPDEMSEGGKYAVGFGALIAIMVGACLVIPGSKEKRKRKHTHRARPQTIQITNAARLRHALPRYRIEAGPPSRLQIKVSSWNGAPLKLVIEPGTRFVSSNAAKTVYIVPRRKVIRINRTGEYAFPVLVLDPDRWSARPAGPLKPRSSYGVPREHRALVRAWHRAGLHAGSPAHIVAALWYLGYEDRLVPAPSASVAAAATRLLTRLKGNRAPPPTPRAAPTSHVRRRAPDRLLRDVSFYSKRRVTSVQFARLGHYADDPRVVALVRRYLESEDPTVPPLALRWLRKHTRPSDDAVDANRLTTSTRTDRILLLDRLVHRNQRRYQPFQLVYARDLAVDPDRLASFIREHPKAEALIARGTSPLSAWRQLVGWRGSDRGRLAAIATVLERDETEYVRKVLARLETKTPTKARSSLALDLRRLAARFPDHPVLWERLEQLAGHSSRWVRTLAINTTTRNKHGGRILARVVASAERPIVIREEATRGSGYLRITEAVAVWRVAALGPARLQRALLLLINARRSAIQRSKTIGAEVGKLLETASRSKDREVAKQSIELVFELKLPNAVSLLRRCQADASNARVAIRAAVRYLRPPANHSEEAAAELRRIARYAAVGSVRRAALAGVGSYGPSLDLTRLLKRVLADDDDPAVRAEVAHILSLLPKNARWNYRRQYEELARTALGDGSPVVRRAAIKAALRYTNGIGLVRQTALEDTDPTVRLKAYKALLPAHRTTARRVLFGWLKHTALRDQRLAVQMLIADFPRDKYAKKKLRALRHHRDDSIRRQVRRYFETQGRSGS